MPDREKVIKGLECCVAYDYKCNDCPYQDDGGAEDGCYSDELKADAIALLKALDVTPEELERLKKCRHECKIDCLLEHYDSIKAERDALLKAQEPVVMAGAELTDAELIEEIRKAPIVLKPNVDAVTVVRCRDCKHRDPEDKKCDYGGMAVQGLFFPRPDNWFCADGERRDDE